MKCDVETVEDDLLALVQAELPAKIAEIIADKADGILLPVPTNAQYFNSTDDDASISNQALSVQYGLIDGTPLSIGSNTAEDNRYIFLIYLDEINQKPGIVRRQLFRYIRAFKEIFEENFDRITYVSNMEVQTIAPTSASWEDNETSPVYKVGGVYIQTSLAS